MSILIVEDEIELASLYREFVNDLGYDVDSFTDPSLALEHFKYSSKEYSLVLTDLRMASMSGIELALKMREINDTMKIFLMTAFDVTDIENQIQYKLARIDRTIQKPIKLSILKDILNQNLIRPLIK
ncbi:MAG TPA: response regulator [Candidatus Nitrosocosmicus sp.]|nr:response regulator [Candidatus Nitrosocosmicus sp.]